MKQHINVETSGLVETRKDLFLSLSLISLNIETTINMRTLTFIF